MKYIIISIATYHACRMAFLLFWFTKRIIMKDGYFKDTDDKG